MSDAGSGIEDFANRLIVCGRPELDEHRAAGVTHLLSIENKPPGKEPPRWFEGVHESVFFGDVESAEEAWQLGVNPPNGLEVRRAIEFGSDALSRAGRKLLVHCTMGMSRSPAVAMAIVTSMLGAGSEAEAVRLVESVRGKVIPNSMVVALVDDILDRKGEFVAATKPIQGGERIEIITQS